MRVRGNYLYYNDVIHLQIVSNTSGEIVSSIVAYSLVDPVLQC